MSGGSTGAVLARYSVPESGVDFDAADLTIFSSEVCHYDPGMCAESYGLE